MHQPDLRPEGQAHVTLVAEADDQDEDEAKFP